MSGCKYVQVPASELDFIHFCKIASKSKTYDFTLSDLKSKLDFVHCLRKSQVEVIVIASCHAP